MIKKLCFTFLFFSLCISFAFSQEVDGERESENQTVETSEELGEEVTAEEMQEVVDIKGQEFTVSSTFMEFIHSLDFVYDIGPGIYMNSFASRRRADDPLVKTPSPIFTPFTIGIIWPNYTFISVEPTLSYFSFYYAWYDGKAIPTEIENRGAATLHFLFNLPVVVQLYMPHSRVQLSAGVALLARYGLMPGGVQPEEPGYYEGESTVGEELDKINKWFWDKTRYLYLSTGVSWLFNLYHNVKGGPTVKVYFPIASMVAKEGINGMIMDIGIKISL